MKYFKILALALGAFFMTACSDNDKVNSVAGVTVEMGTSEISVKENTGTFSVPVKLTGDPNGPVRIQIKVEGTGSNPAYPFEPNNGNWSGNFIVTSETINIPADEKTASIEISTVDDPEENADRTFIVTIVSAEGATLGSATSTLVTIKDNDSVPYEKVQGAWKFNFNDYDGEPASWNVNIMGYDEDENGYGTELVLEGLITSGTNLTLYYYYDEASNTSWVEMQLPEPIAAYDADNYVWTLNGFNLDPSVVRGTFSEDLKTISFDPDDTLVFYVAAPDFSSYLGVYDTASNISMVRQ